MNGNSVHQETRKYRGVRCRKWGKWVSEIRVPATRERLWLGSYATPEAAAVAHDIASYCLRGPSSMNRLNFPHHLMQLLPATVRDDMSPSSIQRAASDAGMAVDAQLVLNELQPACPDGGHTMEVDDMEREGTIIHGVEISEVNYDSGSLDVSIDDYDHIYCLDVSINDYDHIY